MPPSPRSAGSTSPLLTLVLAVLAASSLGAKGCAGSSGGAQTKTAGSVAAESTTVGAPAPDFTLRDLEGRNFTLSDHLGKDVILLNFWATWCVPCGAEMPALEQLQQANKDKGFIVLGIAMDGPETVAQVGPFARRYGVTFPVLLDEETRVVGAYNPKRTAPLNVLIDRKGQISRVRSGYNAGDEKLVGDDVASLVNAPR
jgi:peroxiredoxin